MEQKRTLWIVSAVGVFLLVVVGAALIMYSPVGKKNSPSGKTEISGNINNNSANQLPAPNFNDNSLKNENFTFAENTAKTEDKSENTIKTDNVTVYTTNATVYGKDFSAIDMNSLKNGSSSEDVAVNPYTMVQKTTINVLPSKEDTYDTALSKKAVSVTQKTEVKPVAKAEPVKTTTAKTETKPAPAKTTAPAKTQAKTTEKTAAPKTATAKSVAKPVAKTPVNYWVQVASYTLKKNADDAREALEKNKIQADVFTSTVKGKLYYRVRVGPYSTKAEAQYWQGLISRTSTFADAKPYIVSE